MISKLPTPFPEMSDLTDDYNPGIRLFGKRFIKEQTVLEYAVEFMTVIFSDKWLVDKAPGNNHSSKTAIKEPFPLYNDLLDWAENDKSLQYKPPIKLNLKLFAFFGLSPIEGRHAVHQEQFRKLVKSFEEIIVAGDGKTVDKIELIEQLLQGLQGVGFNRNWCAQNFFPVTKNLLTQETIWNESAARRAHISSWHEVINSKTYFNTHKRVFMARGGELLYLQLCNLFITDENSIEAFANDLELTKQELKPIELHKALQNNLNNLQSPYLNVFEQLIDIIERLDEDTHNQVNSTVEKLSCEWCPRDSWKEGLLFAVEINRIMESVLDPVERLELFTTGCVLQVLRSLCAQSVRYNVEVENCLAESMLGYSWLFTPASNATRQQRLASQRNLQTIMVLIQSALRNDLLVENAEKHPKKAKEALQKEADNRYGHKLFLYLGKKMGVIAPFKGPGARFIMTDALLRYLVLVLLRPGESCEYEEFLRRLYLQYGIAAEGHYLEDAINWSGLPVNSSVKQENGSWLGEKLRAAGFLTELSDGCSIVSNDYARK